MRRACARRSAGYGTLPGTIIGRLPLTCSSFGFRAAMTQILEPESAVLAVINRVRETQSEWNHDLEAMRRPMSVLTIPGHTLFTMTRGLDGVTNASQPRCVPAAKSDRGR